jgi:hypothetical protein
MGTIIRSERDMPERGTFVRFKISETSDWIIGMVREHEPIYFIEGQDPHSSTAKRYKWDEVYEYQVAKLGKGFE